MKQPANELGRLIRHRRIAMGLTQKQAARLIGTTDRSISAWETGEDMPRIEYLRRIAKVYEMQINFLADSIRAGNETI